MTRLSACYAEHSPAFRRFQARVGHRGPHPLVGGLGARLQRVDARPEDLLGVEDLVLDIARLQDLAAEHP